MLEKNSKIYVAGHKGLVGSAILRQLEASGYHNVVYRTHGELDLTYRQDVDDFFCEEEPEYVFLAAAKVGGIFANKTYPAEFAYSNIQIQTNIIDCCYKKKVKKLLFLGSSCIYPKYAPQPIPESALLTGSLEPTNQAYAVSKIAGIIMCQSYNKQYGTNFISVMPTNLYGVNDNYHPDNSHVLPGLIRRIHEAKVKGLKSVSIWGTGEPKREFLYVDDLADACTFLMKYHDGSDIVNIGSGDEITIRGLAETVKEVVEFKGVLSFDPSMPDGTPRKLVDSSKLRAMGWIPKISLKEGIEKAYSDFLNKNL